MNIGTYENCGFQFNNNHIKGSLSVCDLMCNVFVYMSVWMNLLLARNLNCGNWFNHHQRLDNNNNNNNATAAKHLCNALDDFHSLSPSVYPSPYHCQCRFNVIFSLFSFPFIWCWSWIAWLNSKWLYSCKYCHFGYKPMILDSLHLVCWKTPSIRLTIDSIYVCTVHTRHPTILQMPFIPNDFSAHCTDFILLSFYGAVI